MKIYEAPPGMVFVPESDYGELEALRARVAELEGERDAARESATNWHALANRLETERDAVRLQSREIIHDRIAMENGMNYAQAELARVKELAKRVLTRTPHSMCSDAEAWALLESAALAEQEGGE